MKTAKRLPAAWAGRLTILVTSGVLLTTVSVAGSRDGPRQDTGEAHGSGQRSYAWDTPQPHRPDPGTMAVGVTHGQYSIDDWSSDPAKQSARAVLTATASYQNQHIFGWGVLNPEPSPGIFNWSSLDRRMQLIRSTGGTPVITLCCAPDWMKGGRPGETDWNRLEVAPSPVHYDDFAALAVAVARRYPDVRHFQVWNELKGFWDTERQRWDYEAYTRFYNVVYDALKAVDPRIAVGGPYVVVDLWGKPAASGYPSRLSGACGTVDRRSLDVIDYWLRHKHGADFIALDASSDTRDDGPVASSTVSGTLFADITRWVRQRTSLPVWWSEFHVGKSDPRADGELVARAVASLLHMVDAGVSAALVWQPQADAGAEARRSPALWTSTEDPDGGRPLPYAQALARLQQILADRAEADPVSWPLADVGVIRGQHEVLLVHTEAGRAEVRLPGRRLTLGPYEVRYLTLPPGQTLVEVSGDLAPSTSAAQECLS